MNLKQALRLRADYVPPQKRGSHIVERVTIPKGTCLQNSPWQRAPGPLPRARKSTRLVYCRNGGSWKETVMSDTEFKLRTNWEGIKHCRGHVLVGGLGLGLCLKMLDGMEKVESIVCVERSSIVINIVAQHLHIKKLVEVVNQDLYDFLRLTKQNFDTAYADLNYDYNSDHYAEHVQRFKKACRGVVKNPKINAHYWIEDWLKCIAGR